MVISTCGGRTSLAVSIARVSGEQSALLDDRVSRLANYASLGLVLAILWLMVYKP